MALGRPPPLPYVLTIGITGHRSEALTPECIATLRARLSEAMRLITDAALAIRENEPGFFAPDPPRLQFVTPLADGADQVGAEIALDLGYSLFAVLPFARKDYRSDLVGADSQSNFDRLLALCECVLELPGDRDDIVDAYVMTARGTLAHCDLLVALWDGEVPRGRGGTGDVVQLAIARGIPVAHIPTDPSRPGRLLWAAFDPVVDTLGDDPMAERALDAPHVAQVLQALMVPPPDPQERNFLTEFLTERLRKVRIRIEYPLLLAVTGVKKFDRRRFIEVNCAAEIADEWERFRTDCVKRHEIKTPLERLEHAYSWSDRLATRFAQTYRSGHIFNFVFGAFAICLGLSGFMAPAHKMMLALAEFVITLAIILNTSLGVRGEWHRRWLDYRQLAERLRPMRSLKLLGIAAPDPPGTRTNPIPQRWIDWYAMAAWRALGCPDARITPKRAHLLAAAVADHEISPQVGYHQRNSRSINLLDHRLDFVGTILFFATLIVSLATLIGLAIGGAFVNTMSNWFTLVSAGFPALGTAIFGIRFQGDFGGSAIRSQTTAMRLKEIDDELRKEPTLFRAADLTEQAGRVMLGDLDEWRLLNQQRELSV
jgi:hypothetical protein